jgi:DcmR-like sensory protein/putative zinc finger protein
MASELLKCEEMRAEISNYLDGCLDPSLRLLMDRHFDSCADCRAIRDGMRNVVTLVGDKRAFPTPQGFSKRLRSAIERQAAAQRQGPAERSPQIPLGITPDLVPLGSHLIYFWDSDEDFARGVRFLYPGLGRGEHCIVFGHEEATDRVLKILRVGGFDPDALQSDLQLTVLRRQSSAAGTISDIGDAVQAAIRAGASAVRFLGNLGMGRAPLPAGEDDVVDLECKAGTLIHDLPCVIVCMYDVRTLSGRLILKGGLRTHPLAVCHEGVQENPYYAPDRPALGASRLQ